MSNKGQLLQDPFLNALRREHVPVSIYLVNGIKLQGQIESFDQYVVLLRNTVTQMVYKHAISTIVPGRAVNFSVTEGGESPAPADECLRAGRADRQFAELHRPARLSLSITTTESSTAATILVGVDLGSAEFRCRARRARLAGRRRLACNPVARVTCKRRAPDAALFIGSGKADEIKLLAQQLGATEVLFDQSLSPAQQRNLERHLELPVNDRTLLILEIFAQRARSHEGKLQVELARLQYLSTRLVRRWSHLERQSGGIGMRGGPGETQIELDRRMIGENIKRTKERLVKGQDASARPSAASASAAIPSIFRWSATPMPARPPCSTAWSMRGPMPPTSCLRPSTPPPASCIWARPRARCRFPIRWASSATCRTD